MTAHVASLRVVAVVALATLLPAVVLWAAFPQRSDYAGHFLAGAGGTAGLLAVLVALFGGRAWAVVTTIVVAVCLGIATEATVFRIAIFDPVDLAVQSLGAVIVGCGVVGVQRSFALAASVGTLSLAWLVGGFWLAFA